MFNVLPSLYSDIPAAGEGLEKCWWSWEFSVEEIFLCGQSDVYLYFFSF
jgi:hypothetical protein